ncbi:MAG: hypothetical protein IIA49_02555, partial [Bacteroidetes bacterium]|nr:hypothetical protein [Bacteroidota bacterium]
MCLSKYDFVYDVSYPVLIVLQSEDYVFQFPFVVVVDNNQPRKAVLGDDFEDVVKIICKNKIADVSISTSTVSGNKIVPLDDVAISYKCINAVCPIGRTSLSSSSGGESVLNDKFPQCLNGFVIAEKDGYVTAKEQLSTNQPSSTGIILEPLKKVQVDVKILGPLGTERVLQSDETAMILLAEEEKNLRKVLIYPEINEVELAEGVYEVKINLFKERKTFLKAQKIETCQKVPSSGLFGVFGFKEEKCQTIELPAQGLDQTIFGGSEFTWLLSFDE